MCSGGMRLPLGPQGLRDASNMHADRVGGGDVQGSKEVVKDHDIRMEVDHSEDENAGEGPVQRRIDRA